MLTKETAQEFVLCKDNLELVLRLMVCAEKELPISVICTPDNDESYEILPPKNLLIPFLEECGKFVLARIVEINKKAREELNDVTKTN